jgi:peptide chain release factor 2
LSSLKKEIEEINRIKKELDYLVELKELAQKDEELEKEFEKKRQKLEKEIRKEEIKIFLSEKYDKNNTILQIFSGAGGVDAQDWATMLLRMYMRYCGSKVFQADVVHQSFGEGIGPEGRIGTKSATVEIKGNFAYGFLKGENGVHRLVRISPFSSQKLRHTSFVLVEVLPELSRKDEEDVKVKTDDLKIETFRSSGPGGQYVNKTESAIRITHLSTNTVISCQSERSQASNRERAMRILYAKLNQIKEAEREKEIKGIKGDRVSASWGNQIRSYVLHPYKLVKDLRTDVESKDPDSVLEGNLDEFIEAEIKLDNNK